ncbi:MAG TPA: hypothetical protein VGQ57_10810 [Polyangiaceae bacterium]|jgi:hypothetical protein|nr:hypothetical protein [Polyangiaceae bacterium]
MTYEPKFVAVTALALACFSVGFSVTAAAYAAYVPRREAAEVTSPAAATRQLEPSASRAGGDPRGCTIARR